MFFTKNTFLILAQRSWQSFAGLITLIVVAYFLNPIEQGWYYTFLSLAALYSVFEMGLATAILQVSAHIFAHLSWRDNGEVVGKNSSIFNSFLNRSFHVYLWLSFAFLVFVTPLGFYIFNIQASAIVTDSWQLAWIFLVISTAANILFLPFFAVLEGSGKIQEVYSIRLLQGVLGAIACWIALMLGGFLWAVSMIPLLGALVSITWLYKFRRLLLLQALLHHESHQFNWIQQIWPLQWRIGSSWISVYFMSQLATPILFFFKGAEVAGQMGLTLSIAHMIGIFSQSWLARHIPKMVMSVALKNLVVLDRLFFIDLRYMVFIYFLGIIFALSIYKILSNEFYIDRLLPFWQFFGLLVFVFVFQINGALSTYLRAFKVEPLMALNAVGAVMIVGGSILGAIYYSSMGVVYAMVLIECLIILPLTILIWNSYRKEWLNKGHYL